MAAKSQKNARQEAVRDPVAEERTDARSLVRQHVSKELIFAVVGPVGSGTSEIAETLQTYLKDADYNAVVLKARDAISEWATSTGFEIQSGEGKIAETTALQDAGNAMRAKGNDGAAVALRLIDRIRQSRAKQKGETVEPGKPVDPDDAKRAYILDSLRHPAEVALLRSTYQDAFCLIGIVCEEETRAERLREKFTDAGKDKIEQLMRRDERDDETLGQQVADTFHLADFFIDNTAPRFIGDAGQKAPNPDWTAVDELGRLVDLLSHKKVVRPRPSETAMFHAYGARMRSACLSRQVGAALMNAQGEIVATGTNEVPRAGGGVYGGMVGDSTDIDPPAGADHRCFLHGRFCRNTREQNEIIMDLLKSVPEFAEIEPTDTLIRKLRKTRIGQLIEFSRSVHAEMDALMAAARQGVSPRGSRLFVTTFPCHNCARHIVVAGVDEVQFVEPYLKSKALPLHGDAITTSRVKWRPPSQAMAGEKAQVLFRPFVGVAPRLYRRAFYKDRDLKDGFTGDLLTNFGPPDGVGVNEALRISYAELEAKLTAPAPASEGAS